MKFTTLTLLVAATSAIRISQPAGGPKEQCQKVGEMIYEKCNQGKNDGKIDLKEAQDCGIPKKHEAEFLEVAGKDGAVDEKEFMAACMSEMKDRSMAQIEESKGQPKCQDIGDAIYKACNQGKDDGKISLKEAQACGLPKEDEGDFLAVAGKDGKVDEDEFLAACKKHMK